MLQEPDGDDGKAKSLALREDNGCVSVVGLTEVEIDESTDAMEQLRLGTQHRTTASTLMNTVSSRSHAVFTITLRQVPTESSVFASSSSFELVIDLYPFFEPNPCVQFNLPSLQTLYGEAHGENGQEVVSKLSFVDLAGSERLKRTGAEGQRMKEGIQINKVHKLDCHYWF